MKKLIFTTCCFLATVVFCTQSFAGNNGDKKSSAPEVAPCCVPVGTNANVGACATFLMGTSNACAGSGWTCGTGAVCPSCTPTYLWSPSTDLSCTSCARPTFWHCGSGSGTRTYTLTVTCTGSCGPTSATVNITYTACSPSQCRIGSFDTDSQGMNILPGSEGTIPLHFNYVEPNTTVQVYKNTGELVMEKNIDATNESKLVKLDLSKAMAGMYLVQVKANYEEIANQKITIE